jgi:hypothetical protein
LLEPHGKIPKIFVGTKTDLRDDPNKSHNTLYGDQFRTTEEVHSPYNLTFLKILKMARVIEEKTKGEYMECNAL